MPFIVISITMNMITYGFKMLTKGIIYIDVYIFKYFRVHLVQYVYGYFVGGKRNRNRFEVHVGFVDWSCFFVSAASAHTLRVWLYLLDRIPIVLHKLYIIEYLFRVDIAEIGECVSRDKLFLANTPFTSTNMKIIKICLIYLYTIHAQILICRYHNFLISRLKLNVRKFR